MAVLPNLARGALVAAQIVEKTKTSIKELVARMGDKRQHVEVGFIHGLADPKVIERAFYHEFGTVTIPERSFIRSTMKKNARRYAAMEKRLAKQVADGKLTAKQALEWIGDEIAADMQAAIGRNIPPRLKDATIKGKKRKLYARPNIALIATGEMQQSLSRRFKSR